MSEQSAKPYLVRSICEWCADNSLTPYLAVRVNGETRVPQAYVKNGEIVLNIGHSATRKLTIDNDWIRFTARFNGVSQEVSVPCPQCLESSPRKPGTDLLSLSPKTLPRRWPTPRRPR